MVFSQRSGRRYQAEQCRKLLLEALAREHIVVLHADISQSSFLPGLLMHQAPQWWYFLSAQQYYTCIVYVSMISPPPPWIASNFGRGVKKLTGAAESEAGAVEAVTPVLILTIELRSKELTRRYRAPLVESWYQPC